MPGAPMDRPANQPTWPKTIAPFIQAIEHRPDFPRRLAELVGKMSSRIDAQEAAQLAAHARGLSPHDPVVWALTDEAIRAQVPLWHWVILNDKARNATYAAGIAAAIHPGMTVLEIGGGSGILSMLAARAGADHVYCVECQPLLAEAARRNIVANGFSDRITVIEAKSTDVAVGAQLPRRCDALVQELISNTVVGETLLPVLADARARLLVDDPVMVPDRVWAMGQLIGDREPWHIGDSLGLDLSALDLFADPISARNKPAEMPLGPPVELFSLDMTARSLPTAWTVRLDASQAGTCTGVQQWIGIGFPGGGVYENAPGTAPSSWAFRHHWLLEPRAVDPETPVTVDVTVHGPLLAITPQPKTA